MADKACIARVEAMHALDCVVVIHRHLRRAVRERPYIMAVKMLAVVDHNGRSRQLSSWQSKHHA
jgi:hypothetical protein